MLSCLMIPWQRRRRAPALAVALCGIALLAVGCGSSHPGSTGPLSNYTVAVSGSCGGDAAPITHTLAVAVQVL